MKSTDSRAQGEPCPLIPGCPPGMLLEFSSRLQHRGDDKPEKQLLLSFDSPSVPLARPEYSAPHLAPPGAKSVGSQPCFFQREKFTSSAERTHFT